MRGESKYVEAEHLLAYAIRASEGADPWPPAGSAVPGWLGGLFQDPSVVLKPSLLLGLF